MDDSTTSPGSPLPAPEHRPRRYRRIPNPSLSSGSRRRRRCCRCGDADVAEGRRGSSMLAVNRIRCGRRCEEAPPRLRGGRRRKPSGAAAGDGDAGDDDQDDDPDVDSRDDRNDDDASDRDVIVGDDESAALLDTQPELPERATEGRITDAAIAEQRARAPRSADRRHPSRPCAAGGERRAGGGGRRRLDRVRRVRRRGSPAVSRAPARRPPMGEPPAGRERGEHDRSEEAPPARAAEAGSGESRRHTARDRSGRARATSRQGAQRPPRRPLPDVCAGRVNRSPRSPCSRAAA